MVKQWILAAALIFGLLMPANAFARAWRDQKGNIINADFVKVEGGMIYLKPENKYAAGTPFPFYDFSEADQEFVKAILKKTGKEDRIPPPPPKKEDPNGIPGQPNVGGTPIPVTVVPNTAPATPNNINGSSPNPTGFSGSSPTNANPSPSPAVPIAVVPTVPPVYTPPPNPTPSYSPPPSPSPNMRPPFGPQRTEIKQCLNCKKEIPMSSTVGQKCPHCGIYWSEEQNEFGRVVNKAPASSTDWMYSRGAIRLAFLIGAFVIGGICKIVHDNK